MKKNLILLSILLLALCMGSCTSYKNVPYLQDSENLVAIADTTLYDARIMPKDLLTITVSTTEPEASVPFNLTVPTVQTVQNRSTYSQPTLQQYLVDNDGNIEFPALGTLHLGGLTKSEAECLIKDRLKKYLNETPIVNVRMVNYKIAVMGEVARPGSFTISNEKVNIFEALALAGDLTIHGRRDQVKLIREHENGRREIIPMNLTDANIINSPYYFLQQNDVIYVTPNKAKAKTSDITSSTTIWFSIVGTLVSLASLIVTLTK